MKFTVVLHNLHIKHSDHPTEFHTSITVIYFSVAKKIQVSTLYYNLES